MTGVRGSGVRGGRREDLLLAAATLFAERGYHAVGMSEIGAAAGITGPGVYRYFDGKAAILVDLFDRTIDRLRSDVVLARRQSADTRELLSALVLAQARFAVEERALLAIYNGQVHNLPEDDRRRLRRKQRRYVDDWVETFAQLRPDLTEPEARTAVHAAIGVLHSAVHHDSRLPRERLVAALAGMSHAVLDAAPICLHKC